METAQIIADLNAQFQKHVQRLTEEYDYRRLQAQTFADYMVALNINYEEERAIICG